MSESVLTATVDQAQEFIEIEPSLFPFALVDYDTHEVNLDRFRIASIQNGAIARHVHV